jgi:membrane protein CcdC involved in cytochrome C biogenesis
MTPHPEITPWFIATWIILGIVGVWSNFDRNVARKKRLLPVFNIGAGALFVVFVFLISGSLALLALIVPFVVLIAFLNHRIIRVCSACGRTIHSGMWFTRADYCSKCGARLE